jgi:ribosome-associated toxin RatA of RatAB toxin-antitoxin module
MRHSLCLWLTATLVWLCPIQFSALAQEPTQVPDIDVRVVRLGEHFTVDLNLYVPVPVSRAWAVLTDFDQMDKFVPNLVSSEVVERRDNMLTIRQKGICRFGFFSMNFESVQEAQLTPQTEIRALGVSGDFKRMDSVMQLKAEGVGTRLTYHAEVQPDFWFPPLIGPALTRRDIAEQFTAMVREMQRRN